MDKQQSIFIYILAFIIISILLKAFGVINFGNVELLGYALTFYGISLVFISSGTKRRAGLFLGTIVFLTGILLFMLDNFSFADGSSVIYPSVFFILGTGFLMLYFHESSHRVPLYAAAGFILVGFFFTIYLGSPALITFLSAIPVIFIRALPLIIIILLLLLLLRSRNH